MTRRKIAVATGSRADYGIYRPVLREMRKRTTLDVRLLVCGAHLSDLFGRTVAEIERDDFAPVTRIETLLPGDAPVDIARSIAKAVEGFGAALDADRPDLMLLLGDRYEMFAAASAAIPFAIPLAHIHGGETTQGAIDEAMRHSISKMSHLHFVSTKPYATRLAQMGEQPDNIFVTGAPGLDNLTDFDPMPEEELSDLIGMPLRKEPLLVTFHPVTLEYERTLDDVSALLTALDTVGLPVVFTYPNADTNGQIIINAIDEFVREHPSANAVKNLGTRGYFSLLGAASAMVGNSSSGIVEAASFGLPVVDIGNRQKGRIRGRNVLNADPTADSIVHAIKKATDPTFRSDIDGMDNPYGDGNAAARIVDVLESRTLDAALLQKEFHDLA